MPLFAPKFWQKNEMPVLAIVSTISIVSVYSLLSDANDILRVALLDDYLPFIIMLFTLYVLGHGIHIKLRATSNTKSNMIFLGCGCIFSSLIGTTGASMLLLRPFLEINRWRRHKAHLLIFFIFMISNIGGLLTPLGDPPLLLGYLHGVEFSWELHNVSLYWLIYVLAYLAVLYFVDKIMLKKEEQEHHLTKHKFKIEIGGWLNISLILLTVVVLFSSLPDLGGIPAIVIKNVLLLIFCAISLFRCYRLKERIDFAPFREVAQTFLVIFIVIAPVLFILNENSETIQKYIIDLSHGKDVSIAYFWLCSFASSILDNAPSYLLFFNMAGGNANELMYVYPGVLRAITISSVVMGAMTYIGSAANMMVKSIADKKGIKMPSFIGYMIWSCSIILPISFVISLTLSM